MSKYYEIVPLSESAKILVKPTDWICTETTGWLRPIPDTPERTAEQVLMQVNPACPEYYEESEVFDAMEQYASQFTGTHKDFLPVLEENYNAAKRVADNEIDEIFPAPNKRDAVLEVFEDLISIYKSGFTGTQREGAFAEWASENDWCYIPEFMSWQNPQTQQWMSTAGLLEEYLK